MPGAHGKRHWVGKKHRRALEGHWLARREPMPRGTGLENSTDEHFRATGLPGAHAKRHWVGKKHRRALKVHRLARSSCQEALGREKNTRGALEVKTI